MNCRLGQKNQDENKINVREEIGMFKKPATTGLK